jgi:hypothetical protein
VLSPVGVRVGESLVDFGDSFLGRGLFDDGNREVQVVRDSQEDGLLRDGLKKTTANEF